MEITRQEWREACRQAAGKVMAPFAGDLAELALAASHGQGTLSGWLDRNGMDIADAIDALSVLELYRDADDIRREVSGIAEREGCTLAGDGLASFLAETARGHELAVADEELLQPSRLRETAESVLETMEPAAYAPLGHDLARMSPEQVERAWDAFGLADVDDDGQLVADWGGYAAGTDRMDIWHDFDDAYPGGVASLAGGSHGREAPEERSGLAQLAGEKAAEAADKGPSEGRAVEAQRG